MNNEIISNDNNLLNPTIIEIKELLDKSRTKVATQVNQELLITY